MIKSVVIQNFKIFRSLHLHLNTDLNIIVGDNEAGKSTILEAIALALTRRLGGKLIDYELSPFLFNLASSETYLKELKDKKNPALPSILIELYLEDEPSLASLRGSNNSLRTDTVGVKLEIEFDDDYKDEYAKLLEDVSEKNVIPAEYYRVNWLSFAGNAITAKSLPIGLSHIDATTIRLQSGADHYIQNLIGEGLTSKERVALAVAYRKLKESFSGQESIQSINTNLKKSSITEKALTIAIDISQRTNWENSLIPHLDDLPFQLVGKGEQNALKILLALDRKAKDSNVVLIEEPENHLSFSNMSKLIAKIGEKCSGKQIVIATHSAYVVNKLGIEKLILLKGEKETRLNKLPTGTQDYFKKLSGYDTLRVVLAKKVILVEGPSDELLVQKACLLQHKKLPIEMGIDVVNVRGLAFARFLDIAKELNREVVVVTDNDGNYQHKVVEKYQPYASQHVKICADLDDTRPTLEPQFVRVNKLADLNRIFGVNCSTEAEMVDHMKGGKTEWALKIFETSESVTMPTYILDAVK